jgi:hypothetical protein
VQGWDSWTENCESELLEFFQAGGKFKLYVVNPNSSSAEQARQAMGIRLNKPPNEVKVEIQNTVNALHELAQKLSPDQRAKRPLEVFYLEQVNWYFGARFMGRTFSSASRARDTLVFSVYSHRKHSVKELPAISFYPDTHNKIAEWFNHELNGFANAQGATHHHLQY